MHWNWDSGLGSLSTCMGSTWSELHQSSIILATRTLATSDCIETVVSLDSNFTYYKMSNLDNRISNADQLLTQDVEKFCSTLTELYSNLSKVCTCTWMLVCAYTCVSFIMCSMVSVSFIIIWVWQEIWMFCCWCFYAACLGHLPLRVPAHGQHWSYGTNGEGRVDRYLGSSSIFVRASMHLLW